MIVPMRWGEVSGGMRVILSTGRVAHVLPRVPGLPALVMLRNGHGRTAAIRVDPGATVPVRFDAQDAATAALRSYFPNLEFIRETT